MNELQKDALSLQYSPATSISGIEEQVVDLILVQAPSAQNNIAGTVLDGENPVPGATVKVFDQLGNPYMHTLTDVEGQYFFEGIPSGTYTVAVTCTGYRLSAPKTTTLADGNTVIINFAISKDTTLDLGVIAGIINAFDGEILEGLGDVKVTLFDAVNNAIAITYTVDDGEFAFYDLEDGEYTLLATRQGYEASDLISIIVTDGALVNIIVTLIVDTVANTGTFNGIIKNNQGQPIVGCFVGLYRLVNSGSGQLQETLVAYTKTNSQGKYLFGQVEAGEYVVKAKMNA